MSILNQRKNSISQMLTKQKPAIAEIDTGSPLDTKNILARHIEAHQGDPYPQEPVERYYNTVGQRNKAGSGGAAHRRNNTVDI